MTTSSSDTSTPLPDDIRESATSSPNTSSNPPTIDSPEKPLVENTLLTDLNRLHLSSTDVASKGTTTDIKPTADTSNSISLSDSDQEDEYDYASEESYDRFYGEHWTSKREIREYEAQREKERQEPMQSHLENLHQAVRNVDPNFTVFAFGGTIPQEQVSTQDLVLRVSKQNEPVLVPALDKVDIDVKSLSKSTRRRMKRKAKKEALNDEAKVQDEVSIEYQEAEFTFPLMGEKVDELVKFANIAPFGKGTKTVVDLEYRKAMEITPDRFELKPDPILKSNDVLNKIASALHLPCNLRAEIAKLNIYQQGGFFNRHCDTPRSCQHIGTIVLCLPGAFSGGQLEVNHGGPRVKFDWGTPDKEEFGPETGLRWAFLYGDCEHKVRCVKNGNRLTVAYDIFTVPESPRKVPEDRSQSDAILKALQKALGDKDGFAREGCVLAFGLSHSYPKTYERLWRGLESRLKGPDAVLLQAVSRCYLSYSFMAAFKRRQHCYGYRGDGQEYGVAREDNVSKTTMNAVYRKGMELFQVLLTEAPDAVEGCVDSDVNGDSTFLDNLDHDEPEIERLVWVHYPESYGFKNDYETIGNGPCDPAEAYSGVVMLVDIPPADRR